MAAGPAHGQEAGAASEEPRYWLRLNVPAFEATLFAGGSPVKTYPIAVGKSWSQTPLGSFTIVYKAVHPWWIPPGGGRIVPPGPSNPLGTRWMGLSKPYYGLHGTNVPSSIGHAISMGCVRMMPADAEEVFDLVSVGSRVEIVYELVSLNETADGCALRVFADVYGRGAPLRDEILALLAQSGFDTVAIDDVVPRVMQELAQPTGFEIKTPVMAVRTPGQPGATPVQPGLTAISTRVGTGTPGFVPAQDTRPSFAVFINGTVLGKGAVLIATSEPIVPGSLESQDEFASTLWLDVNEACSIANLDLTIRDDGVYAGGLAVAVKQNGGRRFISLLRFLIASGGTYRREGSLVHVSTGR